MSLNSTNRRLGTVANGINHLVKAGLDLLPHNLLYFRRFVLMVSDRCDLPVRNLAGYGVQMLAPEDLTHFVGYHFSAERARQELQSGSACVLVHRDGEAVAWRWGAVGKLYVRHCNTVIETGENAFFSYRLETIESERFRGHVNTCMRTMYDYYKAKNRPLNYTLIAKGDTAVIKWHERCGFQTEGEIFAATLFGIRCCYYFRWPFHDKRFTVFVRVPPSGTREI